MSNQLCLSFVWWSCSMITSVWPCGKILQLICLLIKQSREKHLTQNHLGIKVRFRKERNRFIFTGIEWVHHQHRSGCSKRQERKRQKKGRKKGIWSTREREKPSKEKSPSTWTPADKWQSRCKQFLDDLKHFLGSYLLKWLRMLFVSFCVYVPICVWKHKSLIIAYL